MKENNRTLKSIDVEKVFEQVKRALMKKNPEEIEILEGSTFSLIQRVYNKPSTGIKLHGK